MPLWLAWLIGGLAGVVAAQLWGVPGIAVAAVGVGVVVYVIEWRRYELRAILWLIAVLFGAAAGFALLTVAK